MRISNCTNCDKEFAARSSRQTMCSRECRAESRAKACKRRSVDKGIRFWAKVDKSAGADGCWPWTASVSRSGYGRFRINGKSIEANRIAYELTFGVSPEIVDHRCRNTICCSPQHLRAATVKQNNENRSIQRNNTTGVRGVYMSGGRLRGQVRHNGKSIYLGTFESIDAAEAAVLAKRLELFTHNEEDRVAS